MPRGFKIESEINLLKDEESKNKINHNKKHKRHSSINITNTSNIDKPKKIKKSKSENINKENLPVIVEKKSSRLHKPKIKEDLGYIDKDVIMGKSNPLRVSISKQCENGLSKIKKIPLSNFFYFSKTVDAPSLSKIEKNIKNYKYQSTYEFIMDLRRLWNYYFQNYYNQPDILQKITEMSKSSEEILNEFESFSEDKGEMKEITKKIDSLERELKDIKGSNQINNNFNYNVIKRINSTEKAMSYDEKAALRNNIRLLNPEQKKGIVQILNDNVDLTNKKYFELDIEKLGNKKLRELDNYVQGCLRKNRLNQNNNINNNESINNELLNLQKLKTELNENKIPNEKDEKEELKKEEEILDDLSSSEESDSNSLSSII